MSLDLRVKLNQFVVDGHGRLAPVGPDATPTLFLHWRGLAVTVCLTGQEPPDETGCLAMAAVIGRVMSTAGDPARNAPRREQTMAQLRALSQAIDDGWQLRLLPDHRVSIQSSRMLHLPAGANALLTEVICFLLELRPYLDLLAEAELGIEPAGSGAAGSGAAGSGAAGSGAAGSGAAGADMIGLEALGTEAVGMTAGSTSPAS